MDSKTADAVMAYAGRSDFEAVDITGGAPELNPNIEMLIEGLSPLAQRVAGKTGQGGAFLQSPHRGKRNGRNL